MKLCIDCKHYKKNWLFDDECKHPEQVNPVDGSARLSCRFMRQMGWLCGQEAKLFEEKKEEPCW